MKLWPVWLGTAALALTACASAAQTPPPHVEYEPPSRSRIVASHDCPSGPVAIEIEGEWRLPGTGRVRVVSYSGAAGPASETDLEKWNGWLADLDGLGGVAVRCQQGENESIEIDGVNGRRPLTVAVWWRQGRLGLVAPPPR